MRELERGTNPHERDFPALALIGAGRVGRAIHRAARAEGIDSTLAGRDDALAAAEGSEVVLLCVPDSAIEAACESIAPASPRFVGHTSGALGAEPLASAAAAGAETFGLHPLQTITDGNPELIGASCAVEGSTPQALELAESLARRLGMRTFQISDEQRAAYHAAAAIASNFLVALEESAAALLESDGVEDARELLAPLVLRSAANWAAHGAAVLTGPIARGDEDTVARHLAAIETRAPELAELYQALAARTREIAARRSEALA